jgi:hypothetical protein
MKKIDQWEASQFVLVAKYYEDDQIKKAEMDETCNTHETEDKYIILIGKMKEEGHLKTSASVGRIILKK